jgi:cytochrome c oxidase cbb3-type subunit III
MGSYAGKIGRRSHESKPRGLQLAHLQMVSQGPLAHSKYLVPWSKWAALGLVALAIAGAAWASHLRYERLQTRLLRLDPEQAARDSELMALALHQGKPLYAEHCATCHGATLQGDPASGAPNLTDANWLYGSGDVFDIERTILYGIRTGQSKSRSVSEMPPFGLVGTLSESEIRDVVQYVLQLSGRPHQAQAALNGRDLFLGKGMCGDCHGSDGRGNSGYGAPDLTVNIWNNRGEERDLYEAIYFGEHRSMPGWFGSLTLGQIRSLALFVYAASHGVPQSGTSEHSDVVENAHP